ncbi:hypothetical protein FGG08_003264 [Glutinoglossum americanum]|uniref:BZIP domain-containing protein n=1 Tax=Glutinoglossum americanum TaxID=1670608 RepID=A0A9P8L3Q4_9PEZI|nr:hypothetical protein FGG08_003264 [Glutinoglossum americanum]
MATNSTLDSKKNVVKSEDNSKNSLTQSNQVVGRKSPPRADPPTTINQPPDQTSKLDAPNTSNADASQPLAPPPRPAQQSTSDTPDYFSSVHNSSHFSLEPNPFEQSFGNPSVETPGKSLLPPVAALTSPASLLPGGTSGGGFNWPNSLRSGPLSPAMLTGPTGSNDLFDGHLRGGFPTPNESSIRTGLTPGGGGSMFPPTPSPNSQALFQQLASGGATPGTLDFHRTAMNAAAARNKELASHNQFAPQNNTDLSQTQGQDQLVQDIQAVAMESKVSQQVPGVQNSTDPFGQHDANDAANGLYLLAQARNDPQGPTQFAMPGQQNAGPDVLPPSSMSTQMANVRQAQENSPNLIKRSTVNNASGSGSISGSARGISEMSGDLSDSGASEQAKPNTRNRGKRGTTAKTGQSASNGRRKADASPAGSRAQNSKRSKGNNGNAQNAGSSDDDMGMQQDLESGGIDGKKMTDEEKRKNFLERNRVAALKCRQRKKQWLANLQAKVEIFSSENDALSAQVTQLREEIVNLKTLLLAHKDCPVSQAQGMTSMGMNNMPDFNHHANPYGMGMANAGPVMAGQSGRGFHDGSTQMGNFRKGLGA